MLFLLSCLVAVQHECAHAFAAARLGYRLNKIVLMPFGAVIDGDLKNITLKDEIYVAFYGPFINLATAMFFVAVWWLEPTVYAFTDTACFSSLAIALVNLLPAYPLDGGRILRCVLTKAVLKRSVHRARAERTSERICRGVTLLLAAVALGVFVFQWMDSSPNFSLLAFGLFLAVGGIGNREKTNYCRIDFSNREALSRGMEIRFFAMLDSRPIKDCFRLFSPGEYVVVDVYDERENRIGSLSQNEISQLFLSAPSPYTTLRELMTPIEEQDSLFTNNATKNVKK